MTWSSICGTWAMSYEAGWRRIDQTTDAVRGLRAMDDAWSVLHTNAQTGHTDSAVSWIIVRDLCMIPDHLACFRSLLSQ
jgi:hypothetical protein